MPRANSSFELHPNEKNLSWLRCFWSLVMSWDSCITTFVYSSRNTNMGHSHFQHPAIPECNQYQYIKALIRLCESWLQQHVDVNTYKYRISWSCIFISYLYHIYIIFISYIYITIIHLVLSPDNVLKHPRVHVKWANPSYINTWSHEHAHTHTNGQTSGKVFEAIKAQHSKWAKDCGKF